MPPVDHCLLPDDEVNPAPELNWLLEQPGKVAAIQLTGLDEYAIGELVRRVIR